MPRWFEMKRKLKGIDKYLTGDMLRSLCDNGLRDDLVITYSVVLTLENAI